MISSEGNSIEWDLLFQSIVCSLIKCVWIQSVRMLALMYQCYDKSVIALALWTVESCSHSHFICN